MLTDGEFSAATVQVLSTVLIVVQFFFGVNQLCL